MSIASVLVVLWIVCVSRVQMRDSQDHLVPPGPVKPWYNFLHALRRHPHTLEFVYLSPIKSDKKIFDPYDLQIVSHAEIDDQNFYTMSTAGVTHLGAPPAS